MSQPLVLSASSVNTFLRCGAAWRFAYVVGIKSPPNLKAVRGIAVHKAVEVDMTQKMSTGVDIPVDDMLDAYSDSWNEETTNGFAPDVVPEGEIKDGGVKLLKLYHRTVAPTIQPIAVELPLQFDINGQTYTGQIDLLTEQTDQEGVTRHVIRDTKTTGRKPQGNNYLLNMTGYALGVRQATGEQEADTVLDYLVATNKPYYHEIRMGGPISDDDIRRFAGVVETVSTAINAGQFVPNGLVSGACSWCGYRSICPDYKES